MVTFESATSRVSRLLTMVPWLLHRQGIDLARAAQELGVSEDQVVDDLQLLFVCGLPGHFPDDLIEASWEDGKVFVGNADTISRPLRLGRDEALALVVALRALAATPGLTERGAIDRALAKLEGAAGEDAASADQVRVDLEDPVDLELAARVRAGLTEHRRLHLTYTSASRDETTERDVDPLRVLSVDGRWYLEAWCHRAGGVRTFRLDRIEQVEVLDVSADPPADLPERTVGPGVFRGTPQDLLVTLALAPQAAWVAESLPVEEVRPGAGTAGGDTPGGTGTPDDLVVVLRVADLSWLQRLVLREAGAVRVLGPAEVVDTVTAAARQALEQAASGARTDPDR